MISTSAKHQLVNAAHPRSTQGGIGFTQLAAICSMAVPKLNSRNHNM
jgi:hypothetical protein